MIDTAPKKNPTLYDAVQELLKTSLFCRIAERNGTPFAESLARWLIQYILVTASMNEALDLSLEQILYSLHGKNLRRILQATEKCMPKSTKNSSNSEQYIW